MLRMTEFCTELKDPGEKKSMWDHSAQKILSRAQEFPRTNTFWRLVEHPGEASWCIFPKSLLLPITYLMVCNLNWFACSSPWRFSGSVFDLQKPKMLGNCLSERFFCPVESRGADYRPPASCKGKEVTCTIPRNAFRFRNCLHFPLCSSTKYLSPSIHRDRGN